METPTFPLVLVSMFFPWKEQNCAFRSPLTEILVNISLESGSKLRSKWIENKAVLMNWKRHLKERIKIENIGRKFCFYKKFHYNDVRKNFKICFFSKTYHVILISMFFLVHKVTGYQYLVLWILCIYLFRKYYIINICSLLQMK